MVFTTKNTPTKTHTFAGGIKISEFDFSGATLADLRAFTKNPPDQHADQKEHLLWHDAMMEIQKRS